MDHNHKIGCGICRRLIADGSEKHSSASDINDLYCSSCINFKLLKYHLNLINVKNLNSNNIATINKILHLCFDENDTFLKKYVENFNSDDPDKLTAVNNISIDSIARLNFMLLNVEISRKSENLQNLQKIKTKKENDNTKLSERINYLKALKSQKIKNINNFKNKYNQVLKSDKIAKDIDNNNKLSVIQNDFMTKKRIELINLVIKFWNIQILCNEKKLSILFCPILNFEDIVKYDFNLIMQSLIKIIEFIQIFSQIFGLQIPFLFKTFNNEILSIHTETEGNILLSNDERIIISSKLRLYQFSEILSKIALNVIFVLKSIDETFHIEEMSINDILKVDQLLIRIINKVKDNSEIPRKLKPINHKNEMKHDNDKSRFFCFFSHQKNNQSNVENAIKTGRLRAIKIKSCDYDPLSFYKMVVNDNVNIITANSFDNNHFFKDVTNNLKFSKTMSESKHRINYRAESVLHDLKKLSEYIYWVLRSELFSHYRDKIVNGIGTGDGAGIGLGNDHQQSDDKESIINNEWEFI